jgi:hypothetical protein
MKKLFAILFVAAIAFCADAANAQIKQGKKAGSKTATQTTTQTEVIQRGAPLGKSDMVSLSDVMKDPKKFAGKTVKVEGVIVRSCKKEGCWMELSPTAEGKTVRVKFKDHGFFIPLDAAGMKAKAEGIFEVKVLSKEEVDHLVNDDGAKIERNPDGTANEITFIASGVELRK